MRATGTRPGRDLTGDRRVVVILVGVLIIGAAAVFAVREVGATAAPAPVITLTPAASSRSATFAFTGHTGGDFQCQLDGAAFAACTSRKSYDGLADGRHTFRVRSLTGPRVSAPTSYGWTVDTAGPPAPLLTAEPARLSDTASALFSFSDSEPGVTFRATIDGLAMTVLTSPLSYSGLAPGAHSFAVRAVDPAGNSSATTSWSWLIDRRARHSPPLSRGTRSDHPA